MCPLSSERLFALRVLKLLVINRPRISRPSIWFQLLSLLLSYAILLQMVPRTAMARPLPPRSFPEKQVGKSTNALAQNVVGAGAEGISNNALISPPGNDVSTFPAIVGLDSVTIGASSAYVDSFDSLFGYADSHASHANVFSNGQIDLQGAKVYGNVVSSQGKVILQSGSLVSGDLTYATTLTNSGTVQGTITHQTSSPFTSPIPAACGTFQAAPTVSNNWVTGNFTYDQTHGDLTVSGGQAATLANGTYCLHKVTLSGGSTLTVNGAVLINLTGQLSASGGTFVNTTSRPTNLQISSSYTGNNGVTLSGGTNAYLKVLAPGTSITLSGGSPIFGALVGKTLTVSGNSVIHYDTRMPDTTPPRVSITSPVDGSTTQSASIPVNGTAFDNAQNDTGLANITVNGTAADYNQATGIWSLASLDLVGGPNTITVIATDNAGNQTVTSVTVTRQNQAPTVSAGETQTITLPATANLNGSASDDGLPANTLTTAWSQVDGPGTVTFGDPNATVTTAAFSLPGNYVLRLTANDSEFSRNSEVTVNVIAQNHAPAVNAGADQTIALPNVATLNGSVSDDGLPTGSAITTLWTKVSGPGDVVFATPNNTSTTASFSLSGNYELRLTASDSQLTTPDELVIVVDPENQAPNVNPGTDQSITLPANATLNGTVTDDGWPRGSSVSIAWAKVSGPGNVTFSNPNAAATTAAFSEAGPYVLSLTASDSALSTSKNVQVRVIPENHAPSVNAGADQIIALPSTAQLNGSATDDGYPEGSSLSFAWTKVSGSGNVTFSNPNAAVTTASFSAAGTYVLRLTASDSQLSSSADVTITVDPENQPPVVNAGPDQTITLPASANLNGSVTDDGWPRGSSVSVLWTKVSGPGSVTFSNPTSATTAASFSEAGLYTLSLTATDSQATSADPIVVNVIPENHAPTANAGADQQITLPNVANLNGSVSDDGFPNGSTLTSTWSKVSGPGTVIFANPSLTVTTATFSVAGDYVLRLSVSDSALSGADEVLVSVSPQPNQAPVVSAGNDQTITINGNLIANPGNELDLVDGKIAGWTEVQGTWAQATANTGSGFPPAQRGSAYFFAGGSAQAELRQDIDVSPFASTINAGAQQFTFQAYVRSLVEASPDLARVVVEYRDPTNTNVIATLDSGASPFDSSLNDEFNFNSIDSRWTKIGNEASITEGSTLSDGFDGTSVDPKWTQIGSEGTLSESNSLLHLQLPSQPGDKANLLVQPLPPSGDWTAVTKLDNQGAYANFTGFGLVIAGDVVANPSTTPLAWIADLHFANNNHFTVVSKFSNRFTFNSELTPENPLTPGNNPVWQMIVKNGANYSFYYSTDGTSWVQLGTSLTAANLGFTPKYIGLIGDNTGSGSTINAYFDYFNLSTGSLRISMPSQSTDKANLLVQPLPGGNWELVTRIDNQAAYANYNSSGLLLAGDVVNNPSGAPLMTYQDAHFATNAHYLYVSKWINRFTFGADLTPAVNPPVTANPVWQKIVKNGANYTFWYSTNGIAYSQVGGTVAESSFGFTPLYVGLYTNNAITGVPVDAYFDFFHLTVSASTDGWHLFEDTRPAPAGTGWIRVRLIATRNSGTTNDGFFDSISLRPAGKALLKLDGSASDDGLPAGSTLSTTWSLVNGPAPVTFANANLVNSGALFTTPGTYVLRLNGSDGALNTSDDVTVTVNSANQAPTVGSGTQQTITLPANASLNGTVNDDGLPAGSILSVQWTLERGPAGGIITFANANVASTTASFSTPGFYVLRLTADDSEYSASAQFYVTVNPETPNQAPTVNAGPDQTLVLPNASTTLSGSATDDGNPFGSSLSVLWTKVSGPAAVTFGSPNSAVTTAQFTVAGNYVLRLTSSDSALTSSDDVNVVVNSNQPPVANFRLASNQGPLPLTTVSFSSYLNDGFETNHPKQLLDTDVGTYWRSANGQVSNQSMVFGTSDGQAALIDRVRLQNPYADGTDVNQFEVQVSSATANASDFHSVLIASMPDNPTPVEFVFPGGPATAKFIKLIVINNYGGSDIRLGTFQPVSFGGFDSIASFLANPNSAQNQSPAVIEHGGAIYDFSYGGGAGTPDRMLGYGRGGWVTSTTTNEFAIIQLGGNQLYPIDGIKIATDFQSGRGIAVKDFEVWVSSTTTDASAFTKVLTASVVFNPQVQKFMFPGGPAPARYVKYVPLNNGGTSTRISTAMFDVIAEGTARVIAASSQSNSQASPPEEAFDGVADNQWLSQDGTVTNVWVKVSLEDETIHKVRGVRINPVSGQGPRDFDIRVSTTTTDDSAFTTVYSGTATNATTQDFIFPSPVDAKYVEFYWKNGYYTVNIGVNELTVLADSARGATLLGYSSTEDVGQWAPENAFDIDTVHPWHTAIGQFTNQWLKLSLPGDDLYTIDHVALLPGSIGCGSSVCLNFTVSPKDFELQVSTTDANESSFTTAFAGTLSMTNLLQHFSFTPVQARYVRLLLKNNYGSNQIALNGFYVYTTDHAGPDPRFIDQSTDSDGHVVAWSWDFGDGGTSNQQSPSHHYAAAGTYTVALTVTDDAGATTTHQLTVKVAASGAAPSFAFSPIVAFEGAENVRFTDTTELMMKPDDHRVIDPGNGFPVLNLSIDAKGTYPAYPFPDSGTFNVTLTLGDDNGLKATATQPITVQNLPPSATVQAGKTVVWGESWTNVPQISEISSVDVQSLHGVWDFGDGQTFTCSNCNSTNGTATHAYAVPGIYNPTFTVTDKDGGAGIATTTYTVNRRPTAFLFLTPPSQTSGDALVIHATLLDTYANLPLANKPVQFKLNGAIFNATTGPAGIAEASVPLPAGTKLDILTGTFVGDSFYLPGAGVGVPETAGGVPPNNVPNSGGTNFWLMFPPNLPPSGLSPLQKLYLTSPVDTNGTVTIPGQNFSQNFTVQANRVTTVELGFVQSTQSDVVQNKGIHVVSAQPITVYGMNQRPFTSDAYLGLPVNALGKDHYVLSYGSLNASGPGSQFGVVATEDATTITITPSVTTGSRVAGVPYTIALNQGQTYLLQNTTPTAAADLTGTRVFADKAIAVFGSQESAPVPGEAGCCSDHLVEQLPPTNAWGKRFATIPLATRTKGDFFRVIAAEDNTEVYLNGRLTATLNHGEWVERVMLDPAEFVATKPIMVAQMATSRFYDLGTTAQVDPFMMILPPYSQFLNHYTITTPPSGFAINYVNVVAPTEWLGEFTLDGEPIPDHLFTEIGASGYSGAQIPITVGAHNLDGPVSFGVFVYGFNTDEGYGYPAGMNLAPVSQDLNVTVSPETLARPINSQACFVTTVTNQEQFPAGGRTVTFAVTGANTASGSATTDAAGHAQFCYTGTNQGSDLLRASVDAFSDTASVQWLSDVPNQAPVVNAGADQTIDFPAPASLHGSASDDGLPSYTLNTTWSKVSGPGDVTFADPSLLSTNANFSAPGGYVLRLTATDLSLTSSDDVQILVKPAPTNHAPTANAGPDQSGAMKANLVVNGGNDLPLVNGKIPGWIEEQGTTWTQGNASIAGLPDPHIGSSFFYVGADGAQYAELRQDIDLSAFATSIAAGTQQFELTAYTRTGAETPFADQPFVIAEYRNANNDGVLGTMQSVSNFTTSGWLSVHGTSTAPAGTGWIRIRLVAVRNQGPNNDAYFDSISLRPLGVTAVKLSGAVNDDGLPFGSSVSANWTSVSGPGPLTFSNANAANSAGLFTTPGTYVLRLTAGDGQLNTSDDVTVTITPANQAPVVIGGADQTITMPDTATVSGTVSDDGFPTGSSLSVHWRPDQGPGIVTFANPNAASTTASFSRPGSYTLSFIADDSEYASLATVRVNVLAGTTNQPPVVSAGPDQTITLPNIQVILHGSASDDGQPNVSMGLQWTELSGPATVRFSNAVNSITEAQFDLAGTYVLRLSAFDGQYTTSDDVTITVTQANQRPTVNAGPDAQTILSQPVQLNGSAGDDGLPLGNSLTTVWSKVSGPGTVTFDNIHALVTGAHFSATGTYTLRLTANDGQLIATDDLAVAVSNFPAPTVQITAPADDASVTQPTPVTGSVNGGDWKLEYSMDSDDDESTRVWTQFANGSGAASGTLGSIDPTMMLNGLFDIRLSSTDQYGQTSRTKVSVIVERNLKVGNFTVSFTDLSIPVAGIPMEVTRTYDSRDKRVGDFGFGWTLGLNNIRVEKSSVVGLKWYETVSQEVFPNYCLQAVGSHTVTVTFPGGKVFKFQPQVAPQCQRNAPITAGTLSFTPMPGTVGKLEVVGNADVQIDGSVPGPVNLIGLSGVDIFNSFVFKFTAEDGTSYIVDQRTGLQSLADTSGNTLTISANGIVHSSNKSIVFHRDIAGRIEQIDDPNGNSMFYHYDEHGDLHSYIDTENNTTTFEYDANHRLLTIHDPRNIQPIRNDYDADGRLIGHTDAFNKPITYTHDIANRTETVTDRLNHATVFEYDERGNVLKKTDARGGVTKFTYDADDNVLTEENALHKTTIYTYDANDNRTSITDPLNHITRFTYNALGKVLMVEDPLHHITTNTYDSAGRLKTTEDPLHNITKYTYSVFDGQLISMEDAAHQPTGYAYTGGYVSKVTDALGRETTFTYDSNGNRKSQTVKRTNAQGQLETITTNYEYDKLNRLTKTTFADGSFTKVEYNSIGQQTATVDQLSHRTEFTYDEMGRLTKTTYADTTFEETTYDAEGRRLTSKDRAGHLTTYDYDELGRLTKTTFIDGTFTQTSYDAIGQVETTTDARHNVTRYFYDDAGRRTKVKNALSQETLFTYDNSGNQRTTTDALNHTTAYDYDDNNRRTKTTYHDGSFDSVVYDELGRTLSKTDQATKTTQFTYDELGRLTKVKDALNQETIYGYNELGQQISQTDANLHTTRFEYDQLGRRVKRILPAGQFETYSYDNGSNLQSKTDFNGKTTTFAYDSMRRLLSKTPDASFGQAPITFTYNSTGQRETMNDSSGATVYNYNSRNRLSSKQTPFGTLSYTYDDGGNLSTMRSSNSNGVSVDYSYDTLNRMNSVKDNNVVTLNGGVTNYTYDNVGNLQSYQYPNGVTTNYTYNSLNRLTTMTVGTQASSLASYSYTLGAAGNRTAVTELSGRTVTYTYDDLYRLTSESIAGDSHGVNGLVSYGYDPFGNRLNRTSTVAGVPTQTSTYDANDRLTSDNYDNNGNTTAANGNSYAYDFENHLTSLNNGAVTYVYDGDGNRVAKTIGGVTTNYLVDTNNPTGYVQVVDELQSGAVVKSFTYGHDLISQRIGGSSPSFYQYDGHGSVRQLTSASGTVTDLYDYDAFGNLIFLSGTTPNEYLYSGERFDLNLGFYYLRARYLNPNSGRFVSMDSYEGSNSDPVSLHKYLYANGDPVDRDDPSGYGDLGYGSITAIAIGTVIAAMSTIAMGFFLFNRRIRDGSEAQINVDDQPVIVDGSNWDYSVVHDGIETARGFWNSQANISVTSRPIINLNGCDGSGNCILPYTLYRYPDAQAIRAKLAEKGANAKHLTVFVGDIIQPGSTYVTSGVTDPVNGISYVGSSAEALTETIFWFRWHPAGEVVAHEWGHSFGLQHVYYPNLMQDTPAFLPIFFNQEAITNNQRVLARQGAMRFQ
jgi:RHS repeat-associated protein